MTKYLYLIIICSFFLWTNMAFSQSISGTIVDANSGESIPFITILNKTNQSGVVSNFQGEFNISGHNNQDSLIISGMGYETLTIAAVDDLFIKMQPATLAINEVVISVNREQERRTEAPVAISSIGLATITDNKPTSIDQVLNQTPGVNMVDLGNEQHTMSIRRPIDYGASYLYLEDGIPIRTSGIFNHNALLEINMANVNRIEIIRGPASSMFGSEAIGGAVNFIGKRPTSRLSAGASVQGNNLGYKRTDFHTSNTFKNKIGIRLSGYYADQRNGTLAYTDFNKLALSFLANYSISDKTELSWSNTFVDYSSEMSGSLDSLDFYSKSYGSNQTFTYRKVRAFRTKLALNHYWNDHSKSTITGYFRDNSIAQNPSYRVRDDYNFRTMMGDKNLAHGEINDNSFNSYGVVAQHKETFDWLNSSLIVGGSMDYSPNTYQAEYINIFKDNDGIYQAFNQLDSLLADYQANLFNTAGYAQLKVEPFKNFRLIGALRYDNFNYYFDNNLGSNAFTNVLDGKNTFSRFTPKVGITYDFQNNKGIYANFSEGFVPPQVTTLYVGNEIPSLKPVYYDNYEVGGWANFFDNRIKIEASIYRMDGLNEIISVLQEDGSRLQKNAGGTTHQGIEYGIQTLLHKDVMIRFSGSNAIHKFTDYEEGGIDFSNNDMPQSPSWIANAQITYKPSYAKGLMVSLEWQHIDGYFMDQSNTLTYPGYDIINFRIKYGYKSFEIWTNILNASNELYATVARANAWGQTYTLGNPRNVNIGIGYNFQK